MRVVKAILFGVCAALVMLFLLVATSWMFASKASGQTAPQMPQCGPLAEILSALSDRFQERVLFEAIANDGSRMLVTANPDGTTWSAMTVDLATVACLRIVGTSWRPGAAPPPAGTEG